MSTFVGSTTGVPDTGLVYVDGLLWGSRWQIENDSRRLTYSFVDNQPWDYNFVSAETNAFHNAMQSWANVANFRLEYSGYNDPNAEITFHSVDSTILGSGGLGRAKPPGESDSTFVEGDVMINWEQYQANPNAELIRGSYDYITYVHEIGHALGLAHPHDTGGSSSIYPGVDGPSDPGNFGLNQFVWTVMSYIDINSPYSPGYNTNWGFIGGPMAFDIAAIQYLYGINTTYNTGNNTYYLPTINGAGTYWSCLWDAGGIDTISGQGATNSVAINLNNASLANNDPNAGGYISRANGIRGGFTIANSQGGRCVIENATGGDYNDTLIGNSYNNNLFGGNGNDTLNGGAGNDTLNGGVGGNTLSGGTGDDLYIINSDTSYSIVESSGEGIDTVWSSWSNFNLGPAYLENLFLTGTANINGTGNTLNNTITGNSGNNILNGDNGNDSIWGGLGNDSLSGNDGNDQLVGGNGGTAPGEAGNDYIDGGNSNDTLFGEAGNDTLYGGFGFDLLYGGNGNDTLDGGTPTAYDTSNDTLYGEAGNDFLLTGSGNDYLDGGDNNDILNGWSGSDRLLGGTGNDTLVGGLGNDTLTGGTGRDRFSFYSRTQGIDRITDFTVIDDEIAVSAAGFGGGLVANTFLSASQFRIGSAAITASQRLIYSNTNGALWFDQDGVNSAFLQVQIATLNTGLALTSADIFVIT